MGRQGTPLDWIARVAAVLTMTLALHAQAPAQSTGSINDFRLPPGDEPPPQPVAGPVDPTLPVPITRNPVPPPSQPATAPSPPVPRIAPPPIVIPTSPQRPADAPAPARTTTRPRAPATEAIPSAATAPVPTDQTPATVAPASPSSPPAAPMPAASPAAPAVSAPLPAWTWWLLGGALLGLLIAGAGFGLRRRALAGDRGDARQADGAPARARAAPAPMRRTGTAPPSIAPVQLDLIFEPQSLTMALVNARLSYRLSLTNRTALAVGPISIACDIISAHASLSPDEQLLFRGSTAEPQHRFDSLIAGDTVALTGTLQIPISAILPVRSGDARLFVPLARFHIAVPAADRPPLTSTRIFVIGERPEQPGERLRPIRIDLGPRTLSRISQREIVSSASHIPQGSEAI